MSEEEVIRRSTVRGTMYKERIISQIRCLDCGAEIIVGSMMAHWKRMHGTYPAIDWNWIPVSQTEYLPYVFDVIFMKGISQ